MKRIVTLAIVLAIVLSGTIALAVPVIDITRVPTPPPDFQPGVGKDIDLTTLNTLTLPNIGPFRFHVGIHPGITDLHISVSPGQEPPPISLTQNLFPTQQITGLTADLFGQFVPFSTVFTLSSNVSFDIRPTTVPGPPTWLLLLATGVVAYSAKRLRKASAPPLT